MTDTKPLESISLEAKTEALNRVLASSVFERTERLRDFLVYVVEEEISGRGDIIRGKTIAQDLYGRTTEDGGDPENIVRVDARRLRQQLDQYYATTGAMDSVRIQLEPGSYRPQFVTDAQAPSSFWHHIYKQSFVYIGLFVMGTLVGIGLTATFAPEPSDHVDQPSASEVSATKKSVVEERKFQRTAILGKSPASLEAVNLAEEGRRMIFPIFDLSRQKLLASVFERVIELDPDYFGGYAGFSFVLSTQAILSPDPSIRADLVARSKKMADQALRLAPAQAWTQSTLAWAAFASRDFGEALRLAELAEHLEPKDGQILDVVGSIALFSGQFQRAIEATNDGQGRIGSMQRFANRNIYAAANFHLGNYRESYEAFEAAAAYGDPLSAPSLAYQAAALAALGQEKAALRTLDNLNRAWPNAPLEAMLYGIHSDKRNADAVLDRLRSLGWRGL